jgi:hypothetical protein
MYLYVHPLHTFIQKDPYMGPYENVTTNHFFETRTRTPLFTAYISSEQLVKFFFGARSPVPSPSSIYILAFSFFKHEFIS